MQTSVKLKVKKHFEYALRFRYCYGFMAYQSSCHSDIAASAIQITGTKLAGLAIRTATLSAFFGKAIIMKNIAQSCRSGVC